MSSAKYNIGITFGTFDIPHIGHVRILERAGAICNNLIVGVSSDELNFSKKMVFPFYHQDDRMVIMKSLKCVGSVFLEESLDKKIEYILQYKANVLVMGSDWEGKFDFCKPYCDVLYFPRTENISTSKLVSTIKSEEKLRLKKNYAKIS